MNLQARGLRPLAELAAARPHGDRIRYMAGCRCADCRRANTDYEKARALARKQGDWNGIVAATEARDHLLALSKAGVGRPTVSDVTGISDSVLWRVVSGEKQTIRARTARAILAVTAAAAADGAYIDATPTWKLITRLLEVGYSKSFIAAQLGKATGALQLGRRRLTARNAFEVERLHDRLRHISARRTLSLLDDLSSEGFRRSQVDALLRALADRRGIELDLTVRRGQIKASTADLVSQLHRQLTEVPGERHDKPALAEQAPPADRPALPWISRKHQPHPPPQPQKASHP